MFTNKMMMDSLNIARDLSPIDSGNLRHNAIKLLRRKNGFTIKYSSVDAYYIEFVEEGTSKQKAQHFISNTYVTLANYFANIGDNKQTNTKQNDNVNMDLYRNNPDYRRLVHRNSIFQHYQTQGTDRLYKGRGE
jgi:HK97 gp10 family phage protein